MEPTDVHIGTHIWDLGCDVKENLSPDGHPHTAAWVRQRQDELARLRQIELERREDLEKQAENWVKSKQLREYIQEVEIAASKQGISGPSNEGYVFWIRWAKAHADRLDPLTNGLPFENETE